MARALAGSGFRSMSGKSVMALDLPAAASLAVLSTSSFPYDLISILCLGFVLLRSLIV